MKRPKSLVVRVLLTPILAAGWVICLMGLCAAAPFLWTYQTIWWRCAVCDRGLGEWDLRIVDDDGVEMHWDCFDHRKKPKPAPPPAPPAKIKEPA